MASVFAKLNLKDQTEIVVLNSPESFECELASLKDVNILRSTSKVEKIMFALVFATTQKEVDTLSAALAKKANGDALLWFAYPKGTSKKYKCEFNRDSGWKTLEALGFLPVRQIAIDEDWSALGATIIGSW